MFNKTVTGNHTEIKLQLGVPFNNNETIAPFPGVAAYKSSVIEPENCYMGFDSFGNTYGERLCQIDISHMATLITYIETVEDTNCLDTQIERSNITVESKRKKASRR